MGNRVVNGIAVVVGELMFHTGVEVVVERF